MAAKPKKAAFSNRTLDRLKKFPRERAVLEFRAEEQKAKRALCADKEYRIAKAKIENKLETQYKQNNREVEKFFQLFRYPSLSRLREVQTFIQTRKDPELRSTLRRYVEFSSRFNVAFQLRTTPPHFREVIILRAGPKFHVRIEGARLQPARQRPDDPDSGIPFDELCESAKVKVPDKLQTMIDRGVAEFVLIEDKSGNSALNDLEYISYHPDGITFVVHKAEQPYLLCLIGEKVPKKLFDMAGTVITRFQREYYRRNNAGRPPDLARFEKALRTLKKKGPMKDKANLLSRGKMGKDVYSAQSFLARLKKKVMS